MRILSPKNQQKLNDQRAEELAKMEASLEYSLDLDQTDEELWSRFWKHTETSTGCWEWQGAISGGRYGHLWIAGRNVYAHRIAWALHYGPLKKGQLVLHKCDNPKCVNPDHLFLGTHQDNMDDCVKKGRSARGSKSGRSKLNEEQVLEIKKKLAEPHYYHKVRDLAKEYNVHDVTIYSIKKGRTWSHVLVEGSLTSKPSRYIVNGEEVEV